MATRCCAAAHFRDLTLARADGSLLLARLARINAPMIDDWAMSPLTEAPIPVRIPPGTAFAFVGIAAFSENFEPEVEA